MMPSRSSVIALLANFPPKRMEHDSHSASELSTTGGKIPGLKAMGRLGAKSTLPREVQSRKWVILEHCFGAEIVSVTPAPFQLIKKFLCNFMCYAQKEACWQVLWMARRCIAVARQIISVGFGSIDRGNTHMSWNGDVCDLQCQHLLFTGVEIGV